MELLDARDAARRQSQGVQPPALLQEMFGRSNDALVFAGGDDDLARLRAAGSGDAQHGQIVGFGAATGQQEPIAARRSQIDVENLCDAPPGVFQHGPRVLARPVLTGRVGWDVGIAPHHGLHHLRPNRRGGIVIEVDRVHRGIVAEVESASRGPPAARGELPLPRRPEICYDPASAGGHQGCFCARRCRFMQSSAAVAGRALIMLACVIGIPALALSGSSWSAMLKKLKDFQWPEVLNFASASNCPASRALPPLREPGTPAVRPGQSALVGASRPRPFGADAASGIVPVDYQASAAATSAGRCPGSRRQCSRRPRIPGRVLPRHPRPFAAAWGYVLSLGILGDKSATLPLLLQDGHWRQCRLHPALRIDSRRPARGDARGPAASGRLARHRWTPELADCLALRLNEDTTVPFGASLPVVMLAPSRMALSLPAAALRFTACGCRL